MKAALVYDSQTGNTAQLADTIRSMFEIVDDFSSCDLVFIGSWTDKGSPSTKVQDICKKIKNKKIFYFATCGFGGSKSYYQQLFEKACSYFDPSNEVLGYYICQGKMPMSVRERYQSMLAKQPDSQALKAQIENFDRALDHPNSQDLQALKDEIRQCIKK